MFSGVCAGGESGWWFCFSFLLWRLFRASSLLIEVLALALCLVVSSLLFNVFLCAIATEYLMFYDIDYLLEVYMILRVC